MTTYTSHLRLSKPALSDRGWGPILNADLDALDGVAAVGGLAVTATETPSTTLNVRVAAGAFLDTKGGILAFAGTSSFAVAASSTVHLWIDESGSLVAGSGWLSGWSVPLAVATTGASAITSIADGRIAYRSAGPITVPVATISADYAVTPADSTLRCDATAGPITVTLPAANTAYGRLVRVKKIDGSANVVTVSGAIDGGTSITLTARWQSITLISDGASDTWGVY